LPTFSPSTHRDNSSNRIVPNLRSPNAAANLRNINRNSDTVRSRRPVDRADSTNKSTIRPTGGASEARCAIAKSVACFSERPCDLKRETHS